MYKFSFCSLPVCALAALVAIFFQTCYAQKLSETDVTTLGINPHDNIDDSKAIQDIINKAKPGATLFFPKGVYTIDSPINIMISNITLRGEDSAIFRFANKTDYYALYKTRVGMLNICSSNVTIDRLFIDQNFTGSGRKDGDDALIAGIMIGCSYKGRAVKVSNITVSNCTVYNYYGDGISVFHSSIDHFRVLNDTLISAYAVGKWTHAKDKGEQAINVHSGDSIAILNNVIRGALDDAIAIHNKSKNVIIARNDITTTAGRILMNGTQNGTITENKITYIEDGGSAIWITFDWTDLIFTLNENVSVTNNHIYVQKGVKVFSGIRLFGPGNNITIANNTMETEDKQGIGIEIRDRMQQAVKKKFFGDNIIIKNNEIKNFSLGIGRNISKQVKPPKITMTDNNIINADNKYEDKQQ